MSPIRLTVKYRTLIIKWVTVFRECIESLGSRWFLETDGPRTSRRSRIEFVVTSFVWGLGGTWRSVRVCGTHVSVSPKRL